MNQLMPHLKESVKIVDTVDLNANVTTLINLVPISVKLQEEQKERLSLPQLKEFNSDNNMNLRRKLNFAETLKCMENANSETHAHMLTENINSKRRHTYQAIS